MGASVLIAVRGELDVATAPKFRAAVKGLCQPGTASSVTVDLSRLDFIDAAGLGALISLRNAVHQSGGTVRVRSPKSHVRRVFELAAVTILFDAGSASG
jgi:anti-anti-sigma factor